MTIDRVLFVRFRTGLAAHLVGAHSLRRLALYIATRLAGRQ